MAPVTRRFLAGHHFFPARGNRALADLTYGVVKDGSVLVTKAAWKRYTWKSMESSMDVYNTWDEPDRDIAWAETNKVPLILTIETKTFKQGENPGPVYMERYSAPAPNGDVFMALWDPYCMGRVKALMTAIGYRYNNNPWFGGCAVQETAMGSPTDAQLGVGGPVPTDKDYVGYTTARYRDQMIAQIQHAATAFPNTYFYWGSNFIRGNYNNSILIEILEATKALKSFVLWGPDILEGNGPLEDRFYPIFRTYSTQIPVCIHAQQDSYNHPEDNPPFKTMTEARDYGIDNLHANNIVWTILKGPQVAGGYTYNDAKPVMVARPTFNVEPW